MKKFEIPDFDNPSDIYLRRWNVIVTPWFSIKVHHILRPDNDRALHDHPWGFVTLILHGGYMEELPFVPLQALSAAQGKWYTHMVERGVGSVHRVEPDGLHRIDSVKPGTWTLVLTTGKKREWGFSDGPNNWVVHYRYLDYVQQIKSA